MQDAKYNAAQHAPCETKSSVSTHSSETSADLQLLPCGKRPSADVEAFVHGVNATVATPAGTWERFTQRVMRSSALHLVVPEAREEPVGYAALEGRYLSFFALLPGYRRRGLGGRVIESLLQKNGGMLSLHVRASNAAARRFYDGLECTRISVTVEEDGCYEDGGERLRYVLALRPDKRLS